MFLKNNIFYIFTIFIIYYFCTFFISFVFITKYIGNNDSLSLQKFIDKENLKKNFSNDIFKIKNNIIEKNNFKIFVENNNYIFTGEMTPHFFEKIFKKMTNQISDELSNAKVMLFFYNDSHLLKEYFNLYLENFGEYNFEKYILNIESSTQNQGSNINNYINNYSKEKKYNIKKTIRRIYKKYIHTDYFFLTSPIHFKLTVKHQNIPFSVVFKFNGFIWKINKIIIPFNYFL